MSNASADRYQIIQRFTVGWTGIQYLAIDGETGKQVVLKPLPMNPGEAAPAVPVGLADFTHPHVAGVLALMEDEGVLYAATEHLPATTLGTAGQLEVPFAMAMAMDCLDGLAAGVGRGLLHGNLKPENIVLLEPPGQRRQAKLLEPGFAQMIRPSAWNAVGKVSPLAGDFLFLPPERLDDEAPTQLADLYGLGACLYFALTGQVPYPGTTPMEVRQKQGQQSLVPIETFRKDVPEGFARWIHRLLAVDPAGRPASAREALEYIRSATTAGAPDRDASSVGWSEPPAPGLVPRPRPANAPAQPRPCQIPAKPQNPKAAPQNPKAAPQRPATGSAAPNTKPAAAVQRPAAGPGTTVASPATAAPAKKPRSLATAYAIASTAFGLGLASGIGGTIAWQKQRAAHRDPIDEPADAAKWAAKGASTTTSKSPKTPKSSHPEIVLPAIQARLTGDTLALDKHSRDKLVGWSAPTDCAEWPVALSRDGTYDVELEYACNPSAKGAHNKFSVSMAGDSFSAEAKDTGSWSDFKKTRVGKLTVKEPGSHTLQIKPEDTSGVLMHLRSVTLKLKD